MFVSFCNGLVLCGLVGGLVGRIFGCKNPYLCVKLPETQTWTLNGL